MESKTPKVSIIIPIYNAAKFLNQTLYSVVNQTLKDIEIICVNDCSTDNTKDILNQFSSTDSRIRCIHHEVNAGEGLSRKSGILASTGEYILFLDADDSLSPDACKELYRAIEKEKVDMLQFGTTVIPSGNVKEAELEGLYRLLTPYGEKLSNESLGGLVNFCFEEHKFSFTIWNKIYRGDIVRYAATFYQRERFDIAADLYLFFLIAFFSKTYASVPQAYYFYNFGAGITGGKALTEKLFVARARISKILQNLTVFCEVNDPLGFTEQSIKTLKKEYTAAIVYAFVFEGSALDKSAALECIFEHYDIADVLGELLFYFHNFDDTRKKELVDIWKNASVFSSQKREVKTIGTFYYRITDGGLERVMALLIEMWCKLGYRVILFTDELPSHLDYAYPRNVIRIVVPKIMRSEKIEYQMRVAFWRDMLTRYDVDLMVYHAWVYDEIATDLLSIKSAGIPTIIYTHGLFAHGVSCSVAQYAYNTINISRLYALADAVITLTDVDYNWWSMIHPRVYKTINPSTFDIDKIQPATLESKTLLYLGRIHADKKLEDTLKILRAVLDAGCTTELHIVGDCEYKPYYESLLSLIDELDLESHVKIHGYQTNVEEFYRNASIYVLTSAFEGFSMTLTESMACGVPAVVYDLPNIDIVQKGEGLKVVPQKDVAGAAKAIIELLNDDEKLHALGKAARKSVKEMYSVNLPEFWRQVFTEVGSQSVFQKTTPDYAKIQKAVSIMIDFYLAGVETREIEYHKAISSLAQSVTLPDPYPGSPSMYPGDRVLKMYQEGVMGFRYIISYIIAWLKFKLSGKKKHRK